MIEKSFEKGRPVSLLIMDIDHFKSINDTYGHDVGDEVLQEFGRRLASNIRGIDLGCRYGGEEFVVVMPDTDISFAYMVAERLRQEVADQPFRVKGPQSELEVTISIGIASITPDVHHNPADLIVKADRALYEAKQAGRDRYHSDEQ